MADDIDRILKNSSKRELLDRLSEELAKADYKVIVVMVEDKEEGKYASLIMTLGLEKTYEAYGMLDVARQDLYEEYY